MKTLTYASDGTIATATYENGQSKITLSTAARIPEGDQYVTDYGFACLFVANVEEQKDEDGVNIARRSVSPGTPLGGQLQKILDGDTVITAIENVLTLIRNGGV